MSTVARTSLIRAGVGSTSAGSHAQINNAFTGLHYSWWENGRPNSDKTLGPPPSDTLIFRVMAYDMEGKRLCWAAVQYRKPLGDHLGLMILMLLLQISNRSA